jgi:hypothetical protein
MTLVRYGTATAMQLIEMTTARMRATVPYTVLDICRRADIMEVDLLLEFFIFAVCITLCHGFSGSFPALAEERHASKPCERPAGLESELLVVDVPISAVRGHEFVVGAAFDDASVLEHQNQVGILDRRDAVGDGDDGLAARPSP